MQTPPASAAWFFNFRLTKIERSYQDTIGFSRVVPQFPPNQNRTLIQTPPALAAWSFNFGLTSRERSFRHNRLQPSGSSIST
jgi:hypothetical protein